MDFYGNACEVLVPITPMPLAEPQPPAQGIASPGHLDLTYLGQHLLMEVTFDGPETEIPKLKLHTPTGAFDYTFRRVDAAVCIAARCCIRA